MSYLVEMLFLSLNDIGVNLLSITVCTYICLLNGSALPAYLFTYRQCWVKGYIHHVISANSRLSFHICPQNLTLHFVISQKRSDSV